jgi:hypothetical protein
MVYDFGYRTPSPSQSKGTIVLVMILALGLVGSTTFIIIQSQQIATLEQEVSNLEQDLMDLQDDYIDLFNDYGAMKEAFEEPLTNPVTPTINQVRNWLRTDDTDDCVWVENVWTCGDFAAMLMTRAKERNWRVRIAVVSYSLEGDSSYGSYNQPYGSYGHAFNVIECTDGFWYIEPQSDASWYFTNPQDERTEFNIHQYYIFDESDSGTIWDGYTIWTNYYNQFA